MQGNAGLFSEAAACARTGMVGSALFAFNSNIDLLKRTDAKGALEIAQKANLPKLRECVKGGRGGEEIVSREKLETLVSLGYDERRIGGQAGNMANVAASMGIRAYMHSGVVCRELVQHLHPNVMVSSPFCFQSAGEIMSDGEAPTHFVVDFGADRYIAAYDMHNTHMLINRNFKRCMEKEIKAVERAVISGFHLLDIPEPRGRLEEVKVLLKRWKSGNSRLKIHLELGDYSKPQVLFHVLEMLAPDCDSLGLNEQEARSAMKALGRRWRGEADALKELLNVCRTVVLHTGEYAVAAGKEVDGAGKRLAMGHLLAAFMAKEGRAPSAGELEGFRASFIEVKENVRKMFGKEFAFVPALRSAGERTRLGLGDCFSVGYFCSKDI